MINMMMEMRRKSDVGRNPRGRSFTFGEDPYGEHEERAEEHEEITGTNERNTQPTRDQSHKV